MQVNRQHFRTIWPHQNMQQVHIIDQTKLPFLFEIVTISSVQEMVRAIKTMQVRGAPLIGAAAAYGIALASNQNSGDIALLNAFEMLKNARPTAVNLVWALNRMLKTLLPLPVENRASRAWEEVANICDEDVAQNQAIGQHGLGLIGQLYQNKLFNILTHCNAGWLATVDYGTALAPIYAAHDAGLSVHVWVDETRPRNQGAFLTAWELGMHGVPHTVISDNAGGHLMQEKQVDMVIVGADRVAANGDVCNKIGTYLKALAAYDNKIPFYAAVPSPTIDKQLATGGQIEIENRESDEVAYISGLGVDSNLNTVRVISQTSQAANPAFDVTPARLVTGIITEHGVFAPNALKLTD